jgi:pimeloyl-ACP methyl ester carboxylesterase
VPSLQNPSNGEARPFTVATVPHLPPGFTETFTSRFVEVDDLVLHAVVGGDGPPLLLLPGWPEFWYSWRTLMPTLAERFTVVAADHRGVGASDKPATGYDAVTLADDMAALMTGLGYDRFAVAGEDVGMIVGYALAARHRDRVTHLALDEALLPGLTPSPPLFGDTATNSYLWHIPFNRVLDVNERLVSGREEIYFGHQFASKAGSPDAIPSYAVDLYVEALRDPAALHASFEFFRVLMSEESAEQFQRWQQEGPLTIPVLAIGGERSTGAGIEHVVRQVAEDVTGLVIPGAGHFLLEEAPDAITKALLDFLG